MSVPVLLNYLKELRRRDQMRGLSSVSSLFGNKIKNATIHEHEKY